MRHGKASPGTASSAMRNGSPEGSSKPPAAHRGLSKIKHSLLRSHSSGHLRNLFGGHHNTAPHEDYRNHTTESMAFVPPAPKDGGSGSESRHAAHAADKTPSPTSPKKSFFGGHFFHRNNSSKSLNLASQASKHHAGTKTDSKADSKAEPHGHTSRKAQPPTGSGSSSGGSMKTSPLRSELESGTKAQPIAAPRASRPPRQLAHSVPHGPARTQALNSMQSRSIHPSSNNVGYFDLPITTSPSPGSPIHSPGLSHLRDRNTAKRNAYAGSISSNTSAKSSSSMMSCGMFKPGPSQPLITSSPTSSQDWPHSPEYDFFTNAINASFRDMRVAPGSLQGSESESDAKTDAKSIARSAADNKMEGSVAAPAAVRSTGGLSTASVTDRSEASSVASSRVNSRTPVPRKLRSSSIPPYARQIVPRLSTKYTLPLDSTQIGSGATAVIKVVALKSPKPGEEKLKFAVKAYRRKGDAENERQYIAKLTSEWLVQSRMEHPNVIRAYDLCMDSHIFPLYSDTWCSVMDYCPRGDLLSFIENNNSRLDRADKECIYKQFLRGLTYIHSQGVAHRDLKPENILLTTHGAIRITDFGACDVCCDPGDEESIRTAKSSGVYGSDPYMAPELLSGKEYNPFQADIWSAAIVLYSIFFRTLPFRKPINSDLRFAGYLKSWREYNLICDVQNIRISKSMPYFKPLPELPEELQRLFFCMATPDPSKRFTAREALETPYVQRIECCCYDENEVTPDAPEPCLEYAEPPMKTLKRPHHH
ncbi:HAL protein kinase [Schizosaccharomyces japonicus yFS275]|uniref:HAL protein kinase n=1 Tax=Schizosaccharomyces japonicus (strain yFS275 / FY16936) TaxID=402676 RepID=B6K7E6_SCHJY|nr:HAL protein kinase [Schizosaccharomyces japonicus yFS275]EEB09450.1 HAL protein kinase [Schizosaccharomyces japonicus yFS275]